MYFSGKPIEGQLHESLRLYSLCKVMRWAHLPVAGGLYDQEPRFIDDMWFLIGKDEEAQRRRQKEQEAKQKNSQNTKGSRSRRRR